MISIKLRLAALTLSLGALTSCQKPVASDLGFTIDGISTSYVLPVGRISCTSQLLGSTDPDVKENTFQFRNVGISWANTEDSVYVLSLQLKFKSANITGGEYSCLIAGEELYAIFATGVTPWSGTLTKAAAAATPTSVTSSCALTCGDFKVLDTKKNMTLSGTVTVMGIQKSATTQEEKVVKGTGDVELLYQGF